MTITQLIQSSPANANELFAKLAETSNGAVKTRETLFNELKAELEQHARLEEEHLFPVLRKHKEMKDLVRSALNDNKQARALVAELDGMWKEGGEFLAKLEDLRKVFQQHVRDEKKELLPAVKTALSNEEAQGITEKVEADKAAVEATKRQEAEERRPAARQEREKAERRRAQAEARKQRAREEEKRQRAEIRAEERRVREEEKRVQEEAEAERRRARETGAALARTGEDLVRGAEAIAASGAATAQAGTGAAVKGTQEIGNLVGEALENTTASMARMAEAYSTQALPSMDKLQALVSLPQVLTGAAARAGETWLEMLSRTAESGKKRSLALMQCFTPPQVAQVQSRYLGETVQAWLEANSRMLEISVEAYRSMVPERATEPKREPRAGL
jgi:hypothetical protein